MKLNSTLQKDRYGVNTILVIAVVVIVIIAAGAIYVLTSGNDDKEDDEPGLFGIGSEFEYDVTGTGRVYSNAGAETTIPVTGTMTSKVIGQNKTQIFLDNDTELKVSIFSLEFDWYYMHEKSNNAPVNGEKIGSEEIDTIDGRIQVDVYKYNNFLEGMTTAYVDVVSQKVYFLEMKDEDADLKYTLKSFKIAEPTKYEPLVDMGKKFTYNITEGTTTHENALTVQSVAACMDGYYGICITQTVSVNYVGYQLSPDANGLAYKSESTGKTQTTETIDGVKKLTIYSLGSDHDNSTLFYVDLDTMIMYKIVNQEEKVPTSTFELTSYA